MAWHHPHRNIVRPIAEERVRKTLVELFGQPLSVSEAREQRNELLSSIPDALRRPDGESKA